MLDHGVDVGVQRDGELPHDGLLVQQLDAVERRERLARVGGALEQQLAELDEPLAAEPAQVDHPRERVERLRRADVVGRLLAPDVLLARLQREDKAAAAVDVGRLARDPAGHAADVGVLGGEEAEARAAEVQPVAERLALADGDVDPEVAGRPQDPERQRVALDDDERPGRLGGGDERLEVLDGAEEVGVLQEDGGDGVVQRVGERLRVGRAVGERDLLDLRPPPHARAGERLAAVRVHAAADQEAGAARLVELGEVAGGGERARTLVDAGVGDRQARQLGDRGLVLEHHLQPALGDLRLVGRVGRQELRARDDRLDDRRDVVVVHPRPEERDLVLRRDVLRGEVAQVRVHLLLGLAGRQVERPAEPDPLGDVVEQLVDRGGPDRREHRAAVVVGGGGVAAHARSATPGRRRRPSARRARTCR